jgi:hypothetical protein
MLTRVVIAVSQVTYAPVFETLFWVNPVPLRRTFAGMESPEPPEEDLMRYLMPERR